MAETNVCGLPQSMLDSYQELAGTIRRVSRGRPVHFVSNYGNWGDALIREGALAFLSDFNIPFVEILSGRSFWIRPLLTGGTLLYNGGGAWTEIYGHGYTKARKYSRRFDVVVLPSSYQFPVDLPKAALFRRDNFESQSAAPASLFCHDMAFYLQTRVASGGPGDGEGYFFRTDREASGRFADPPPGNRDISTEGNDRTCTDGFFSAIDRFRVIHTDRLHVSIAGCLLNKEVHLWSGAYFKNRAVYLSSMAPFFDNVTFEE